MNIMFLLGFQDSYKRKKIEKSFSNNCLNLYFLSYKSFKLNKSGAWFKHSYLPKGGIL